VSRLGPRGRLAVILSVILITCIGIPAATLAIQNIAGSLGRSADLTGRVPLWAFVIEEISKKPLFGYGLDAFFIKEREGYIMSRLNWVTDHAHNGLIDLAVELGLVGAVLGVMVFYSFGALLAKSRLREESFVLCAATWMMVLFMNLTESNYFRPSNILWLLLICSAAAILHEGTSRPKRSSAPGSKGQVGGALTDIKNRSN
jgi:O-antigen ligase